MSRLYTVLTVSWKDDVPTASIFYSFLAFRNQGYGGSSMHAEWQTTSSKRLRSLTGPVVIGFLFIFVADRSRDSQALEALAHYGLRQFFAACLRFCNTQTPYEQKGGEIIGRRHDIRMLACDSFKGDFKQAIHVFFIHSSEKPLILINPNCKRK